MGQKRKLRQRNNQPGAVDVSNDLVVTIVGVLLAIGGAGGSALVAWILSTMYRMAQLLATLEEATADHDRRLTQLEGKCYDKSS